MKYVKPGLAVWVVGLVRKVLSVRVFAGGASVTDSRPAAVGPLALSQFPPYPRAASPACAAAVLSFSCTLDHQRVC